MRLRLLLTITTLAAALTFAAACGGGGDAEPESGAATGSTPAAVSTSSTSAATPAATQGPVGRFEQAGMVENWQPGSQPDPSRNFANTFAAGVQKLDLAYKLTAGPAAEVWSAWKYKGEWVVLPGKLRMQATAGQWTSFTFSKPGGSEYFEAGDYEVTLIVPGEAATRAVKFTITPVTSTARFEQVGLVKRWDSSVAPDPSTFVTSFAPTDGNVYAVFRMNSGTTAEVTATWKHAGKVLEFGELARLRLEGGRWGTLYMNAPTFPSGDYEVVLTLTGSSESRTLNFTVGSAPAARPKFEQVGLLAGAPSTVPNPANFITALKPTDQTAAAVFKLTPGSELVWVTAQWKYLGAPIYLGARSTPVQAGAWDYITLEPGGGFPPGEYESLVSIPGSEEPRSLKFIVR
jgi:hypothetical protein